MIRGFLPRGWGRATAAAALVLTVAACSGLPTSDQIQPGLPVLGAPLQDVQALPDGPASNAGPDEIMRGFLLANSSFDDAHEVARQFLTDDLARSWRPTEEVLVYQGDPQVKVPSPGVVEVTVTALGEVDTEGGLTELAGDVKRTATFPMIQVDGQWRISSFPDSFGVWLTDADFKRRYQPLDITYLAPGRPVFVPDVRWFPRGDGLATALARAQAESPPDYLDGAVRTGVPPGAELTTSAVPVDPSSGIATVDLRGSGLTGSDDQQRQLLAQFARTLMQAPAVSGVQVQTGGRPIDPAGVTSPVTDPAQVGYTTAVSTVHFALLRRGSDLFAVDPFFYSLREYTPVGDEPAVPPLPQIPTEWVHLATNQTVTDLAAISVDGRSLQRWQRDNEGRMEGIGTDLTPPSYDRVGGLWIAGVSTTGPRVWVVDTKKAPRRAVATPVEADWLEPTQQILHFQVGPDDTRAVIHLRDKTTDTDELGLVGIVRDRDGRAVALTQPVRIGAALFQVSTVSWASPTQVVVLARQPSDAQDLPYLLNIGGWMSPLAPVSSATLVRGVPAVDEGALILIDDRGRIHTQEGDGWGTELSGEDLIVPGN